MEKSQQWRGKQEGRLGYILQAKRAHSGALFHGPTIIRAMGNMRELKGASAVERAMRVDLAAAFRLAVRLEMHEGVCNHFSVMLPHGKRFFSPIAARDAT
jgi:hypothetical protein